MTQVVHLHVGGPKSGTTFIQQVLEHNADTLAKAGVLVVGPRLELIHAAMAVRGDHRLDDLPDAARHAWDRVVEQVRAWQGSSAIVSYELFANASAEQVRTALARLDGIEVHVVVSARDLGKAIASSWQEQLKFGITKPLESWSPPQESAVDSEWGWRTMQPAHVAARWGADLPAERVHVVTVPSRPAGADELWHRFAAATGLDGVADLDLGVERANESLGVVEAELLRRVNAGLDGRIRGGRQRSLWLRDLLAHTILAPIGREPIGLTDAHADEAAAQAEAAIAAITAAGYRVHGDLEDLRPTRAEARLPGEVSDTEVAGSAALALADLLVWARDAGADVRTPAGGTAEEPADGRSRVAAEVKGAVRGSLTRLAAPVRDRRVARLEKRIAELEAQVEQSRALHLRVATLSDVVAQLLLPAAQQDEDLTMAALRSYRDRSL
ncbi:DUF6752 domain-containing protein [Nocardioides sp.]|uniref:DUF6752 domain-containing protein n=1 Tax=Nocardioides sp. TaxID=35761 RepID=UPI002628CFC2|nr:DUF6752 domain-containing protein [Nocardioides sp.]MCW2735476.1 hypothetical protein [Nocardioides sp.]